MPEGTHILIVDDEPSLLGLMKTYLGRLGYVVTGCADGASTRAEMESGGSQFELMVADVTLPDVDGIELALTVAKAHPELKVLLCSGIPVAMNRIPKEMRNRFSSLDKPFAPNQLAGAIEKLLRTKVSTQS